VTTVAYVFKVTLNNFAVPRTNPQKKNNKYENCTLFRNNKYEFFTPFNEGDLNETYIFLQLFFLIVKL
jgi:hypothetical protein